MITPATPDAGHNWLNDKAYGALRGEFHVSDLGAWPIWGAQRGGHRGGARACGAAGFRESGGRLARGTGMMAGSDGSTVAGGPARHVPVLGRAALAALNVRDGGIYIDGTFGAGGYSRAILDAADTQVIAIDRDQSAVAASADLVAAANGRLTVVEERFSALDKVASKFGHEQVDGVVLDIGVSSMQLDEAGRGFSFRLDGPLDMRMGGEGPSAADVVARASERDLADIIFQLGEERHSRAVARAIVAARKDAPIASTRALADIVERVVHSRPGTDPSGDADVPGAADVRERGAQRACGRARGGRAVLKPSGRLAVVSFHSLEDRIVKTFLTERSRAASVSRHMPEIEAETPTLRW